MKNLCIGLKLVWPESAIKIIWSKHDPFLPGEDGGGGGDGPNISKYFLIRRRKKEKNPNISLSAWRGWRRWSRWWRSYCRRSRGSNYQVPAPLSCLPNSPLCMSCYILPESIFWKSLFCLLLLNIKVLSSICRSLLSLGMTSGMAGEGVGGSVGELEMAAWLQQVFYDDKDNDCDDVFHISPFASIPFTTSADINTKYTNIK